VVRNRKLVNQLAEDTKLFDLDYGVLMASHDEYDTSKSIQVCSIDTITARGEYPHITSKKDIILIIDEADQSKSSTYQSMINKYLSRTSARTFLLGMTATPYNQLDHFDEFINPITPKELLEQGFLVDYKYYIPKESVDYSNIIVSKGEWSTRQVGLKLNTPAMIKSNFESWLRVGETRQTLVFCMDKKHAENFCAHINDYYGSEMAAVVTDKTKDADRNIIFNKFNCGKLRFLINIKIIGRGVDIPCIGTILDCAATLNINWHIQKLGRGSRPNEFYKDCIVIDPAKNLLHNGHFYQYREISLTADFKRNKKDLEVLAMRVCSKCFRASEPQGFGVRNICPYCGHGNTKIKKPKLSKAAKDKLFMESASPEQIEQRQMIKQYKSILWQKQHLGMKYKYDMACEAAHMVLLDKHGIDKVIKIRKTIGLKDDTIATWKRRREYVPLGGTSL